jgi:glycosyltransferase involved in cell wall biosynthesis
MRFHVVSLPHTQTTLEYSACAFTEKVRKFCVMMTDLGHEVFLYAGDQNEAPCTEHVACISETERSAAVGGGHFTHASFDYHLPHWRRFNARAAEAIKVRAQKTDFLCVIGGLAHKQIADALPALTCVEFGVGYGGTFSKFRVFESYAWRHTIYGAQTGGNANAADGHFFDEVIPGYLEAERFPFVPPERVADGCGPFPGPNGVQFDEKAYWEQVEQHSISCDNCRKKRGEPPWKSYYLFIGRLTERKGFQIAADACKAAGKRLIIAGQGTPPSYGEHVGVVGPEERGRLMAGAIATFVPTIYVEPFGNVAVESMACGTPVIATDWGAMTETVLHGVTGYRCRMFGEFLDAMERCKTLDPRAIRKHAIDNYSLPVIGLKYQAYFERLLTLWGRGWYELPVR